MNALATDQAKRIAELIDRTPSLKGQVTAGLYVGGQEQQPTTMMSATQVITYEFIVVKTEVRNVSFRYSNSQGC